MLSSGAGKSNVFETVSASADYVLISSTAVSGASSWTTDSIDSTYKLYRIMVNITAVNTQYSKLYLRLRASATDITATNYDWTGAGTFRYTDDSNNGTWYDGNISEAFWPWHGQGGLDTDTSEGVTGEITLYNPSETVGFKTGRSHANFLYDSARWYQLSTVFQYGTSAAYTGVTIYTSAGTMSGTINLYGVK